LKKLYIAQKPPENVIQKIPMSGLTGSSQIFIPSNYRYKYLFLSLYNDTPYTIVIPFGVIPAYTAVTIPFTADMLEGFSLSWTGNVSIMTQLKLIFSDTNLGYNCKLDYAQSFDRRGLAANKPAANTVTPGTTYWSVDTDIHGEAIEITDGTNWGLL